MIVCAVSVGRRARWSRVARQIVRYYGEIDRDLCMTEMVEESLTEVKTHVLDLKQHLLSEFDKQRTNLDICTTTNNTEVRRGHQTPQR